MKLMKWKLLLIAAAGLAFSGTANAQTSQNIDVTAFVPNVCIFDATSQTTMVFDLSGVAAATTPFDQVTTLAWSCSTGYNPVVTISPGASGDQENRLLFDGPIPLPYNLYTDSTFTTIWGDGTGTTGTVSLSGIGMSIVNTTNVFGRIQLADAQAAVGGIYTDTVLVTILP
ncbi:MAG TPA: spore coat protein U domain-containing protein [Woeseiaceae bacterium]|nr:spore coat protein U domain-containing protein [Woeseiaceae bacterium]